MKDSKREKYIASFGNQLDSNGLKHFDAMQASKSKDDAYEYLKTQILNECEPFTMVVSIETMSKLYKDVIMNRDCKYRLGICKPIENATLVILTVDKVIVASNKTNINVPSVGSGK